MTFIHSACRAYTARTCGWNDTEVFYEGEPTIRGLDPVGMRASRGICTSVTRAWRGFRGGCLIWGHWG